MGTATDRLPASLALILLTEDSFMLGRFISARFYPAVKGLHQLVTLNHLVPG